MENKDLFEKVDENTKEEVVEPVVDDLKEPEVVEEASFSSMSQQEKEDKFGKKIKADGRTLTIKSINITNPKTSNKDENGTISRVEPNMSDSGSLSYTCKLAIKFEEDNIIEYYPSLKRFVNNGILSKTVSVWREGNSKVSEIFRMAMVKMLAEKKITIKTAMKNINGKDVFTIDEKDKLNFSVATKTISDADVLTWMIGKKVLIKISSGNYKGKEWFRNDIKEFV